MNVMKTRVESAGGHFFLISKNHSLERINRIDGLIIPGGRDIHPKHYN